MISPISKSAFMKADQCLKQFYLYKNHPNLRDKISSDKQFIFKRGTDIGIFAQKLFPNGVDVSNEEKRNLELFAKKTQTLIEQGVETIYEATFIYNDLLIMVDILHKKEGKWIAYEVKSSLKITETFLKDACFQYYVIKNCLPTLVDFNLLTLNPKYVLQNELDIFSLFRTTSILNDAEKNLPYFSYKVQEAKLTLEQNKIPNIKIGAHCFQPYDCDFLGLCWKNIYDTTSIFSIGKLSKSAILEFYNNNIFKVEDIDINKIEKQDIKIQVLAVKENKEQIMVNNIKPFLENIKEPYCSLDIEVWMSALPFYQKTKPFQQIPFLFSLVYNEDGVMKNQSYFKPIEDDLRLQFLEHILSATKSFNTILMYDKSLEENVLNQLSELFPQYLEEIKSLKNKIVDLAEPIKKGYYYHPEMKGNFSLKSIAPLINQEESFNSLDIQSGISAMFMYESLLEKNIIEAEHIKQQLIDYCELDSLITYQLYQFFKEKVN